MGRDIKAFLFDDFGGNMTDSSNPDENPKPLKDTDKVKVAETKNSMPEKSVFNNDIIELTESLDETFEIEIVELTEEIPESNGIPPAELEMTGGEASIEKSNEPAQGSQRAVSEKPVELTDVIQKVSETSESMKGSDITAPHIPQEPLTIDQKLAAGIRTYYGLQDVQKPSSQLYPFIGDQRISKAVKDIHHPEAEAASVEETYELERELKESPDMEMTFETSLGMQLDEEMDEGSSVFEKRPPEETRSILVEIPKSIFSEGLLETLVPGSTFKGDEKLFLQLPVRSEAAADLTNLANDQAIGEISASTNFVSGRAIETALVNVIKKLYAEKIEHALEEAIERIVKEDIEKLKGILFNGIQPDH
jgi:hypothetical protein